MVRRSISAYSILAFPLAVLFVFTLLPSVAGLALSLFQWDGGTEPRYVGAGNFRQLWADPRFLPSLWNTLRYVLATVPLTVGIGFLLAIALNARWFRGKALVRTAIFLPTIVSIVAIGFLWRWLLDDQGGLIPTIYNDVAWHLDNANIRPFFMAKRCPSLLRDGEWPMVWVIAASIWRGVGFWHGAVPGVLDRDPGAPVRGRRGGRGGGIGRWCATSPGR